MFCTKTSVLPPFTWQTPTDPNTRVLVYLPFGLIGDYGLYNVDELVWFICLQTKERSAWRVVLLSAKNNSLLLSTPTNKKRTELCEFGRLHTTLEQYWTFKKLWFCTFSVLLNAKKNENTKEEEHFQQQLNSINDVV